MKKLYIISTLILSGLLAIHFSRAQSTVGGQVTVVSSAPSNCTLGTLFFNTTTSLLSVCKAQDTLATVMVTPLTGTTGSIGGGLLLVGASASGTASVTGATTGMACIAQASDGTNMAALGATPICTVTASGTVTVNLVAIISLTPAAKTYNVRVFQ